MKVLPSARSIVSNKNRFITLQFSGVPYDYLYNTEKGEVYTYHFPGIPIISVITPCNTKLTHDQVRAIIEVKLGIQPFKSMDELF